MPSCLRNSRDCLKTKTRFRLTRVLNRLLMISIKRHYNKTLVDHLKIQFLSDDFIEFSQIIDLPKMGYLYSFVSDFTQSSLLISKMPDFQILFLKSKYAFRKNVISLKFSPFHSIRRPSFWKMGNLARFIVSFVNISSRMGFTLNMVIF